VDSEQEKIFSTIFYLTSECVHLARNCYSRVGEKKIAASTQKAPTLLLHFFGVVRKRKNDI
jgi:hypothetical protein